MGKASLLGDGRSSARSQVQAVMARIIIMVPIDQFFIGIEKHAVYHEASLTAKQQTHIPSMNWKQLEEGASTAAHSSSTISKRFTAFTCQHTIVTRLKDGGSSSNVATSTAAHPSWESRAVAGRMAPATITHAVTTTHHIEFQTLVSSTMDPASRD